jgi:hypothetical protein
MPTARPTLVFPASVREQVMQQHTDLRAMMRGLLDECACHLRQDETSRARFAVKVHELSRYFASHLEFEEQTLSPILAIVDHWGPERRRDLHEEHSRQRAEFARLIARMDGGCNTTELVRLVRNLITDLTSDMDEEEYGCLRPALLGATFLEIERR